MRVVRAWHRLPREAVVAPSLEVPKARLEGDPGSMSWGGGRPAHGRGLSLPTQSMILWCSREDKNVGTEEWENHAQKMPGLPSNKL